MKFDNDGYYYENGTQSGEWELDSDCKTLNFKDIGWSYTIEEISATKLVISGFGTIEFY